MSSVASSNASDAASTTGSTASADSVASTVASADSGVSVTSTVPSAVPSTANSASPGTESAAAAKSKLKALKEWYSGAKSSIGKYLKRRPNTPSAPPTSTQTVADYFGNNYEGVQKIKLGPDGTGEEVTVMSFDASQALEGKKEITCGDGTSYTLTWGPAAKTSFNYVDHDGTNSPPTTNTATDTKKTMPSLAPFLKLPEPTIPAPPEWFKSCKPSKMGPAKEMSMLMSEFPVLERYKDENFTQEQCYEHDMNDRALMEALKKAKIDARTASNFALIDKSSYYMSQAGKVPSAMASFVLGTVYKDLILPEKKDAFEKALEKEFNGLLSHPTLPVTEDGLDTYRWAATLRHEGELKGVDPTTAHGRHLLMRQARVDIWNATEVSYNAATDAATKVADWLHVNRNDKKGTGPVLQDLLDYAFKTLNAGGKLPKGCPQSILDIAKARDEMNKSMRNSSLQSTKPSAFNSLKEPRPNTVLAHEAQTSGHQSDTKTGTKVSLPDSLLTRVKTAGESIGVAEVQSFFDRFPPQGTAVAAC